MEKGNRLRYHITIISRRRRLLDKDNIYVKDALDSIKGIIIEDDSPEHIELEVRQEKVDKVFQECTIIEVREIASSA